MRFCSLASSSSGNCYYVGSESTHILIDGGISKRRIEQGLAELGLTLSDISAILVTHEHSDHVKGLDQLAKRTEIPFYGTAGTLAGLTAALPFAAKRAAEAAALLVPLRHGFPLGDLFVDFFALSHDAAEPVGFTVSDGKRKFAVCTDTGIFTEEMRSAVSGADVLVCEANYDEEMLAAGPYPAYLKRRIAGRYGHLSNRDGGRFISSVLHDRIRQVVLGHLSPVNNLPFAAERTVRAEIRESGTGFAPLAGEIPLFAAPKDERSPLIEW